MTKPEVIKEIIKIVYKTNHTTIRELDYKRRDYRPKFLVFFKNERDALQLKKRIDGIVKSFNSKRKKSKETLISFNTKVLHGYDLIMNIKGAHKTLLLSKKDVLEGFDFKMKWLMLEMEKEKTQGVIPTSYISAINILQKDIAIISGYPDDTMFNFRLESGVSYRMTYFDEDENIRKEASVGELCIIYSDERIELSMINKKTKERSDIKNCSNSITQSCQIWLWKG